MDNAVFEQLRLQAADALGCRLFTVMRYLRASDEVERVYSSDARAYPPGGRKSKRDTDWSRQVLESAEPYFANDEAGIRAAFDDAEKIIALGLGAVINVPVQHAGLVIGTLNFLREAGGFTPAHRAKAQALAPLAVAALRS